MPATKSDDVITPETAKHIERLVLRDLRCNRIERDIARVEEDMREQATGSQDGYLLDIANRLRQILA